MKSWLADRRNMFVVLLTALYLMLAYFWQTIAYYDESFYLDSGNHVHVVTFLTQMSLAPLYALWFRVLSYVCPDAVWRYFLSWGLLVVGAVMLPLLMHVRRAWVYAVVLLCLPFFSVLPYVSLFASVFLVVGLCLVLRKRLSLAAAMTAACVCCFLVAFARPEYAYGVFLSALAALVVIVAGIGKRTAQATAAMLLVVLSLTGATRYVTKHSDTSRSGSAFVQHVNLRAWQKGLLGKSDPWLSDYAQKAFGVDMAHNPVMTTAPIGDYFRANPRLFLSYMLQNLLDVRMIVLLLLVLAVSAWPWIRPGEAWLRPASIYVFLISLPTLASSLLITPEHHYAVIVFPSLLLLAVQMPWAEVVASRRIYVLACGLLLGLSFVGSAVRMHRVKHHPPIPLPGIMGIECLRQLEKTDPVRNTEMFDPLGLPDVYFAESHKRTAIYELATWNAFGAWVGAEKPGWVLVNPTVPQQYHISLQEIDQLLQGLGYAPHACPAKTALTVYVLP